MSETSEVTAAVSRHAGDYDAQRRRLVPPLHHFYGAVVIAGWAPQS